MILTFFALTLVHAQSSNFKKILNDEIAAPQPRTQTTPTPRPVAPAAPQRLSGDRARVSKLCGNPPQWNPGTAPWAQAKTWGYPFREDGADCRVHFHFDGERLSKKDLGEGCVLMGPNPCRDLEP